MTHATIAVMLFGILGIMGVWLILDILLDMWR